MLITNEHKYVLYELLMLLWKQQEFHTPSQNYPVINSKPPQPNHHQCTNCHSSIWSHTSLYLMLRCHRSSWPPFYHTESNTKDYFVHEVSQEPGMRPVVTGTHLPNGVITTTDSHTKAECTRQGFNVRAGVVHLRLIITLHHCHGA